MISRANKTTRIFLLSLAIALLAIIAFAVLTIVDMSVNWAGAGIGRAFQDSFTRLGNAFNFSKWSANSVYQNFVDSAVIVILGVGLITCVFGSILIAKKKFYLSFVYIGFVITFSLALSLFIANIPTIYETNIANKEVLSIVLYIFAILLTLAAGAAFVYFVLANYRYNTYTENLNDIIILEETIVEETETVGGKNTTNVTIITNNYYSNETTEAAETHDYVEEAVLAPMVVATEVSARTSRRPFALKLQDADQSIRDLYNEIKAEFISYGLKSRISVAADTFRLHTITYAQIQISGKNLKIYFALDPKDYEGSTYPVTDVSKQKVFADTPVCLKVKSGLSVRRAKDLIEKVCEKKGVIQEENPEILDYSKEAIDALNDSKYYQEKFLDNKDN